MATSSPPSRTALRVTQLRYAARLLLIIATLGASIIPAWGWQLAYPALSESIAASDFVLVARVSSIAETGATFEVAQSIKGAAPAKPFELPHFYDPFSPKRPEHSCFKKGAGYLLFLNKRNDLLVLGSRTDFYDLRNDVQAVPMIRAVTILLALSQEKNPDARAKMLLTTWNTEVERTWLVVMENFLTTNKRDPATVPFLTRAFDPKNSESSAAHIAAHVIAKHQYVEAAPELLKSLERKHWSSIHAARALGLLGEKRAYEPILELINDPSVGNREYFIEALGHLKDRRSIPFMLSTLYRRIPNLDPEWETIRSWSLGENINAAQALGEMKVVEAIPRFLHILKLDGWDDYKCGVIEALARMGPLAKEALPALEEIAMHGNNRLGTGPKSRAPRAIEKISEKSYKPQPGQ